MTTSSERPAYRQRLAAAGAIILSALVIVSTFLSVVDDIPRLVAQLALLAAAGLAAWYGLTRVGRRRAIAVLVVLAALMALLLVGIAKEGGGPLSVVVRVVALLLAVALARFALGTFVP